MSDQIIDQTPTEQCENCLRMIDSNKISTHFAYCRRNIKKCQQCFNMYDFNEWEEHEQEFHKRFKCQNCGIQVPDKEKNSHINACPMKPKRCEYCDLAVPSKTFQQHFKACESRTNPCEKCGKPIQNKQFLQHISFCEGIDLQEDKNKQAQKRRALFYDPAPIRRPIQSSALWAVQGPAPRKKAKPNYTQNDVSIATSLFEGKFDRKSRNRAKYVSISEIQNKKKPQTVIQIDDQNEDKNEKKSKAGEKGNDEKKIQKKERKDEKKIEKKEGKDEKKTQKKEQVQISSSEVRESKEPRKRKTRQKK